MIVHAPEISVGADGEVSLSARVEPRAPGLLPPGFERLWFGVPREHQDHVSHGCDAFAAALILSAMALGEDLEVRGPLSPRLFRGLHEYQKVLHAWEPHNFKIVDIRCEGFLPTDHAGREPAGAACSFSGGVDSFYTLWSHLPRNEVAGQPPLTHALFIHGVDIPLDDEKTCSETRQTYTNALGELGIELLLVRTNVRTMTHFLGGVDWHMAYGGAIAGMALLFGPLLRRFYFPSAHTYENLVRSGAHPVTDHLFSTETLEVCHDGAGATRAEKTLAVAELPTSYKLLRVCTNIAAREGGLDNCCRCGKCLRTMVLLEAAGVLGRYETFPEPLDRARLRRLSYFTDVDRSYARQNAEVVAALGRADLARDVRLGLARGLVPSWIYAVPALRELARETKKRAAAGRNRGPRQPAEDDAPASGREARNTPTSQRAGTPSG